MPRSYMVLKFSVWKSNTLRIVVQWIYTRPSYAEENNICSERKPSRVTTVLYLQATSDKINRPLVKFSIKIIYITAKKNAHLLRPVEAVGFKVPGIYCIPCECGKVYVRQMVHTIKTSCKEHAQYIRLFQPAESVVAEHSTE